MSYGSDLVEMCQKEESGAKKAQILFIFIKKQQREQKSNRRQVKNTFINI